MEKQAKKKIDLVTNSPIVDENNYGDYVEVLHEKIHDDDVKNIGIIAPYGAGKSSLIKTYKKRYPKEKSITISLANFNSKENSETVTDTTESTTEKAETIPIKSHVSDIECEVEKSILQQFIFSESKGKMPNSKINRIGFHHFWYSLLFSIFTLSLVALTTCAVLEILKLLPSSKSINFYWFFGFAILSAVILLFVIVYNRKLERIGVKDIEATFCESQGSILNTFIDELLYFFKATETNNVIIEDLDRFDNTNLFSKLREINFIINNSKIVKQKVTFIYAVKDDLFVLEEERAKFFEFIISLTPVLNSDNAKDYLKNALEKCPNEIKLPESFMVEITQFIQEMRVLKNIINDYKVYYHTLKIEKLNDENKSVKLFSLMVYKNLRPQDFAKLQFSKGYLAAIFKNANTNKNKLADKCEREIEKLKILINDAKKEAVGDFEKLKHIVRSIIVTKGNNGYSRGTEIGSISTFTNLNDESYIYYSRYNTYYLSVESIEQELGESLIDFENRIINKSESGQKKLNEEIIKKLKEKKEIVNYSLKEILLYQNDIEIKDDLLRFLLVNGYIAEDYLDYIIKVGETIMTNNDRQFIKDILAKKEVEYSKKLDKPELVFKEILPERFNDKYVLNFDLINYVLESKFYDLKKENVLKYLMSGEDASRKFIVSYLNSANSYELLIDNLADNYIDLSSIILNSSEISFKIKVNYIRYLLSNKKLELIISQNSNNSIADFLRSCSKVIDLIAGVNPKNFIALIENLKIELEDITCEEINFAITNQLVNISAYEINQNNLEFILFTLNDLKRSVYQNALMSAILNCGNKNIIQYCADNSIKLLNVILTLYGCREHQEAIETILNDGKLAKGMKEKFINKLQSKFNVFDNIEKELLSFAFAENKVIVSWDEISKAFEGNKVKFEVLFNFIKTNIEELSKLDLNNPKLVLFICNNVDEGSEADLKIFTKMAKAIKITVSASEVNVDKICAILVENNVVIASEENLMECVDKVETIIAMFLKNAALIENIKYNAFTGEVTDLILQSAKTDPIKLALMNALEDIYTPEGKTLKMLSKFLVALDSASYPFGFLKVMFENNSIDKKDKIKLFIQYNGKTTKEQLFSLFKPWSEKFSELETVGKISVGFSEISDDILEALQAKNLIKIDVFKTIKHLHKRF